MEDSDKKASKELAKQIAEAVDEKRKKDAKPWTIAMAVGIITLFIGMGFGVLIGVSVVNEKNEQANWEQRMEEIHRAVTSE